MPELWRNDYPLTALPPVTGPAAGESITDAVLAGQPGGGMVMVYQYSGYSAFPDVLYSGLRLLLLDPFGNPLGPPATVTSGAYSPIIYTGGSLISHAAVAAAGNGAIAVAFTRDTWISPGQREGEVFLQLFDRHGLPIGNHVNLNINSTNPSAGSQTGVSLTAFGDGSFAAVWTESPDSQGLGGDGSGAGIFFQRFAPSGGMVGGLTRINTATAGDQNGADIAVLANGEAWVTWASGGDVYGQRVSASGLMLGSNQRLWNHSAAPAGFTGAAETNAVALAGGGFALVWRASSTINISDPPYLLTQVFDATGSATGALQIVQSTAIGYAIESFDATSAPDGGYTVVVNGDDSLVGRDHVSAVRFLSDGTLEERTDLDPPDNATGQITTAAVGAFTDGRDMVVYNQIDADSLRAVVFDDRRSGQVNGSTRDDVLVGHAAGSPHENDIFVAREGNDSVYGLSGNDYLYMGAGNDVAVGGDGIDVLLLDGGDDYGYGGAGTDYIFGGEGHDTLVGEGGVDVLQGEAGNDIFDGGADGDHFYGGDGNDYAYGRDGNDIFVMQSGNDQAFGETGQDYFYMGDGDDQAHGGEGVDVFLGGAGNDVFEGGSAVDYAWGEAGNDAFVVRRASGVLVVQDFAAGGAEDAIRLAADTNITSFRQAVSASTYYAGMNTTIVTVDADTSIWLVGVNSTQLTASDFIF